AGLFARAGGLTTIGHGHTYVLSSFRRYGLLVEYRLGLGEPLLDGIIHGDRAEAEVLADALEVGLQRAETLDRWRRSFGQVLGDGLLVLCDLGVHALECDRLPLHARRRQALGGAEDLTHAGVVDQEVDQRGGSLGVFGVRPGREQHGR